MVTLLRWAIELNSSAPAFQEALGDLRNEDSIIGRIIRRAEAR